MGERARTIVIDNGSHMMKIGMAGRIIPSCISPSVIGHPKYELIGGFSSIKDTYIGDEAWIKAGLLSMNYPIEHGIVKNWDDMERILVYAFYSLLKKDPTEHPVLLSDSVNNSKTNREKMAQIMFEVFDVPSYCSCNQGFLSFVSSNRITGIILDIGDGVSQITPVYECNIDKKGVKSVNFAGKEITEYLQDLLYNYGYCFSTSAEKEIVREIKEKTAYIADDYYSEIYKSQTTENCKSTYLLSDGTEINLNDHRFKCTELFFKPHLHHLRFDGIDKILYDSIMECNINERCEYFKNIITSGGCTSLLGFNERLNKEIRKRAPIKTKINVVPHLCFKASAWLGGSIFASSEYFAQRVITRDEYFNEGLNIIHRKCY